MTHIINIQYTVSASHRPTWLLKFIMRIRGLYKEIDGNDLSIALNNISNLLNEYTHTQRTLERSCRFIRREIKDNKLFIYSSTGNKILVSIEFELKPF